MTVACLDRPRQVVCSLSYGVTYVALPRRLFDTECNLEQVRLFLQHLEVSISHGRCSRHVANLWQISLLLSSLTHLALAREQLVQARGFST